MAYYCFLRHSDNEFSLFRGSELIASFSRRSMRETLETKGFSSHQIGSLLTLLNRTFPYHLPYRPDVSQPRSVVQAMDYLLSKGYRVYVPEPVPDEVYIQYLEAEGYHIEGVLNGEAYCTADNNKGVLNDSACQYSKKGKM